ncbi:MAG: transcription-repair coupling factor [Alphaproteobacteria bacterium]|nr:transcription-repair coupling factor [Alphaproteobacteria bacterium]
MTGFEDIGALRDRPVIAGAPEGADALVLARLAAQSAHRLLHICRDDRRLDQLAAALAFFAPDLDVQTLPAWDCLPYDRVSPNGEIVSRRVEALAEMAATQDAADGTAKGRVLLTTASATLQRVPPREMFRDAVFRAGLGARIDLDALYAFLDRNGYVRAGTVREPGEYAVRGGIVDLFPPGTDEPLRLDLFGDELETVRSFDAMSQRTTGQRDGFEIKPVSEVLLGADTVARFRTGYRELFGAARDDDALYESISAGRRYAGMEHWLPLFHPHLETVFDYLPDSPVTLDHQADQAVEARLDTIAEYYGARLELMGQAGGSGAPAYKPVPPETLFLDRDEWGGALASRPGGTFSPFAPPEDASGLHDAQGRGGRDFADARNAPDVNVFDAVGEHVGELIDSGRRVLVAAYSLGSRDRLATVFHEHGLDQVRPVEGWAEAEALPGTEAALVVLGQESGFVTPALAVITEQDILGDRLTRPSRARRRRADEVINELSVLNEGDFVVHSEHGIGRYEALVTLDVGGAPHDCLKLVYAGNDKLFVPVENIDVLSRFGSEEAGAQLDRLGGAAWQMRKSRAKARIKEIADALLKIAAERQLRPGSTLVPAEGLYDEFSARFPFPETDDQARAIGEVLDDLGSGRPMDRLICGDVGFGKTEVALRAAFTSAMSGLQVAVVVPTTLLARQHYQTFQDRFRGLPLRIRQLSRLVPTKEQQQIRDELAAGTVDIVVGTHALLSKRIKFRSLGLLIVDEEQHFGVAQKERLKQLRADVHVLTLTATPIPRTLQMALAGVREMSIIATPPIDRLAVRTFVLPYDPVVVREAILRERFRGGQTFYVCPRIQDLARVRDRLGKLIPDLKVATAHGAMPASELEAVMSAFYEGQFELLLSTNIVESGLDIPTANTLIIHRAEMFGLAQLYQLRGRIGRSKVRAYAYLTLPPDRKLSRTAEKRLQVMQTLDTLGAGFSLASHDLDIRGAGNLLGEEQSGQIREVGIELYQQMLEEAVAAARGGAAGEGPAEEQDWTPAIGLGTPVLIPEDYVADLPVRLGLYRRIASLVDAAEIDAFAAELIDRFGPLPDAVENLLRVVAIKRLCLEGGVEKVDAGPKGAILSFRNNQFANPEGLVQFIAEQAGKVKLRPDHSLVYRRHWDDPATRLKGVEHLVKKIAAVAGDGGGVDGDERQAIAT